MRVLSSRRRVRGGWLAGVVIWVLASGVAAAAGNRPACPDTAALIARVRALCSPDFKGRGNGTPEALAAAESVTAWFAAAGLEAAGDAGGWHQDFALKGSEMEGLAARNVCGRLPGRGRLAGRWLVVGAHYDHLGAAAGGLPDAYHPGADDNASGVAVLCELAHMLRGEGAADPRPARGVVFVAFAGEEIGLQGSRWFVEHLPMARDSVDAMINLDSVGRLREGRLYVAGVGSAEALRELVEGAGVANDLRLEISRGGWDAGDHVSFLNARMPALFLMTGPHAQYHTRADDWRLVSSEGLARVARLARDLVASLRTHEGSLVYTDVEGPPPARPRVGAPSAEDRRAWFGIMPDFVESAEGVRVAGVLPDSPAAQAGLAPGDVIVAFDGRGVGNLQDYTLALRARAPGDEVVVELQRGAQLLRLTVVLAARAEKRP